MSVVDQPVVFSCKKNRREKSFRILFQCIYIIFPKKVPLNKAWRLQLCYYKTLRWRRRWRRRRRRTKGRMNYGVCWLRNNFALNNWTKVCHWYSGQVFSQNFARRRCRRRFVVGLGCGKLATEEEASNYGIYSNWIEQQRRLTAIE